MKEFSSLLFVFLLNNMFAQSVSDTTAKRVGIRTVIRELYWRNDSISPALIDTEYYNRNGNLIYSVRFNPCNYNINSINYCYYNNKAKLSKNKCILYNQDSISYKFFTRKNPKPYYPKDSFIYKTKYRYNCHGDIKNDGRKYKYDKQGRITEIMHKNSYVLKDVLVYDAENRMQSFSKYRRDSLLEVTTYYFNDGNQIEKDILRVYKNGQLLFEYPPTNYVYNKNGLLQKSYDDMSTDVYYYKFY